MHGINVHSDLYRFLSWRYVDDCFEWDYCAKFIQAVRVMLSAPARHEQLNNHRVQHVDNVKQLLSLADVKWTCCHGSSTFDWDVSSSGEDFGSEFSAFFNRLARFGGEDDQVCRCHVLSDQLSIDSV